MINQIIDNAMAGPFGQKYTPHPVVPSLQHVSSSPISYLITEELEKLLSKLSLRPNLEYLMNREILLLLDSISLPPLIKIHDIHATIAFSQAYENEKGYSIATGLLISRLIKKAHHDGVDQFVLDFEGIKPIDYLCYFLESKRDNSLEIC